jgi:hypothetical protein
MKLAGRHTFSRVRASAYGFNSVIHPGVNSGLSIPLYDLITLVFAIIH